MNYDVTYSLRVALDVNVPEFTDVQMVYDGVSLTGITKPFATIEYLQGGGELITAGRTSYLDTFNFQIGVFARNISERHRLESKVRDVIRKPDGHPLYVYNESTGKFVDSGDKFVIDDNGFTSIGNDDSSAQTYDFHGYFDVSVEIL